jgi:ribonucleoside-diphosphate reductase alpha chain
MVPWDDGRIIRAVGQFEGAKDTTPEEVLSYVTTKLGHQSPSRVGVEHIQDLVEAALMDLGEHDHARHYISYRRKRQEQRADRGHPDPTAIADFTHISKYGRFVPDLGRRELWDETVTRLMRMHQENFPEHSGKIQEVFDEWVRPKLVLPSARSLQFGGQSLNANHARMYNCAFTFADRPQVFQELFFLLLSGSGCGFSVQRRHVRKLPPILEVSRRTIRIQTIEDSIIGWADALGALIDSYVTPGRGDYVEFDYSLIRVEGSTLKTSGGRAPGHVPLKMMLEKVRALLDDAQGRPLKSVEVHDIMCEISIAVLAGGIRRSAMISLFDPDDPEMLQAKTGEWYKDNPQRAMANNSAVFSRVDGDIDQFHSVFEMNKEFGEPGFLFLSGDYGCNPCGEIGLNPVCALTGKTGWAFCNLTEINGAAIESPIQFHEACRVASFIGTLQASYTDFPYLDQVSKNIADREALIGVGITGLLDNRLFANTPDGKDVLLKGANEVKSANQFWASHIGIRQAARCTTVKPSGTLSLLLGGVGSGVHPHHARRYFRRVTANKIEVPFLHFKKRNPYMCEEKPNGDWVITFPMEAPSDAVLKADMTAKEFMDYVFHVYESWVAPGTALPFSSIGLTHNISCTVNVRPEEWATVRDHAWANRQRISAMAFLPELGDKVYSFAPREEVTTEEDLAKWSRLISTYKPVDWSTMVETEDGTELAPGCEGGKCEMEY